MSDLRALLAAATGGPWTAEVGGSEGYYLFGPRGLDGKHPQRRARIAAVTWGTFEEGKANAALIAAAINALPGLLDRLDALSAAVDRVRRRHPRGEEESGYLAPGLWCPTCGHERKDNGHGGCPDRNALIIPGLPLSTPLDAAT